MILSIIYYTIFTFLFAAFNALVISWAHFKGEQRKTISKFWHATGRLILGFVLFILWKLQGNDLLNIIFLFSVFNLSWTIWDLLINALRKVNGEDIVLFHTDTKGINKYIMKVFFNNAFLFWLLRIVLLILNAAIFIY